MSKLSEAELECRKRLSEAYEGQYRNGVFTNCGFHGTASGYIVRDGTYWIATFRNEREADDYVAFRNSKNQESVAMRPSPPRLSAFKCSGCGDLADNSGETIGWALCSCGSYRQPSRTSGD